MTDEQETNHAFARSRSNAGFGVTGGLDMSTKQTIKYQSDDKTGAGFHLYEDLLELDDDGNGPVHLSLSAVQFEAGAGWREGGGGVDVTIPRAWAEALGLVTPNVK